MENVGWHGMNVEFEIPGVIKSNARENQKNKRRVRKRGREEKENVDWHGVKVESTF